MKGTRMGYEVRLSLVRRAATTRYARLLVLCFFVSPSLYSAVRT